MCRSKEEFFKLLYRVVHKNCTKFNAPSFYNSTVCSRITRFYQNAQKLTGNTKDGQILKSGLILSSLSLPTTVTLSARSSTIIIWLTNLASWLLVDFEVQRRPYVPPLHRRWCQFVRRRLSAIGDRAFPVAAAGVWNSLLQHHCLSSAAAWRHLFRCCFSWSHPP